MNFKNEKKVLDTQFVSVEGLFWQLGILEAFGFRCREVALYRDVKLRVNVWNVYWDKSTEWPLYKDSLCREVAVSEGLPISQFGIRNFEYPFYYSILYSLFCCNTNKKKYETLKLISLKRFFEFLFFLFCTRSNFDFNKSYK